MGIKQYIPGTYARQERLFSAGLHKMASKGDALCFMEYADGAVVPYPAEWCEEPRGWRLSNGTYVLPRGKNGKPKEFMGTDVIYAHTNALGPVSTDTALLGRALEEDRTVEVDEQTEQPVDPEVAAEASDDAAQAVADGGHVDVTDKPHYPEVDGFEYDAIEISLADATLYDPYPATGEDAQQLAEWMEIENQGNQDEALKYIGIGAGAVFLLIILFIAAMAGINSLTGSGGGGSVLPMMLGLLARPALP